MIKERPILMNAEMVRATLRRHNPKTQTRRMMSPQIPSDWEFEALATITSPHKKIGKFGALIRRPSPWIEGRFEHDLIPSPVGKPGDRLYVRETFGHAWHHAQPAYFYRATDEEKVGWHPDFNGWTPSIHMPRSASRIDLEVTSVRIEHLQDISEKDVRAEGVIIEDRHTNGYCAGEYLPPYLRAWRELWESINGAGSWDANPWVWVVEFKRIARD